MISSEGNRGKYIIPTGLPRNLHGRKKKKKNWVACEEKETVLSYKQKPIFPKMLRKQENFAPNWHLCH